MFHKLSLILIIIILSFFFHYYNKHKILQYGREFTQIQENLEHLRAINSQLKTENNKLRCRGRIQRLAIDELDMMIPTDDTNIHNIRFDPDKNYFCLIDYIIPSAEAITRE